LKFINGDVEITETNPNHFSLLEREGFKKVEEKTEEKKKK
jgi:hypothetical protein